MANNKLVECLKNCEGNDCKVCDETHQKDIDNCPCNKNCPGEKSNFENIK